RRGGTRSFDASVFRRRDSRSRVAASTMSLSSRFPESQKRSGDCGGARGSPGASAAPDDRIRAMRMRTPAMLVALTIVALTACGGSDPDPKTPATAKDSGGGGGSGGGNGVNTGDKAPGFAIESLNGQGKLTIAP